VRTPKLGAAFWRMYAATAWSDLADGIGRTALPLAAASYTRNPVAVSGLVTFAFLPWLLFALPSGVLVDRLDRRYAMAGANAARAVAVAVLAVLLVAHVGNVAVLYVVAFVLGVAETVYDSAVRALLPQLVERDQLDKGNSLVTVEESLGQTFVGAPLGSVVFAAAIALPFVLNAAGFLLAVLLILTVRGSYRPVRAERTSVRTDMVEGVGWLRRHGLLRGLTLISAGCAFASAGCTGVLVLYSLEVLQLPSGDFGLLLVVAGIGGVLGSLVTPRLARALGRRIVVSAGGVVSGAATAAMALTHNGYLAAALFGVASAGVMTWNVLTMSLRQALIPHHLFGRVQGAYRTLVWGVIPLGAILGGWLADALGIRTVFAVAGAVSVAMALALARLMGHYPRELADMQQDPAAIGADLTLPVTRRSGCARGAPDAASAAT
jgi:MFS family permease